MGVRAQELIDSYLEKNNFADLAQRLTHSPLAKDLANRNDIWKELLTGERIYIQHLVSLYESYCGPLKSRKKLLTETQVKKIFQNVEEIKELAKTIWKKLEASARAWPAEEPLVGKIFVDSSSDFAVQYPIYVRGITDAIKNLMKVRRNNAEFEKFLQNIKVIDVSGTKDAPLPLMSLLMVPIIRLYEYETLINELLVVTTPDHPDYANLTVAKRNISELNATLIPSKNEALKLAKVLNVISNIKDEPNQADIRLFFMNTLVREKTHLVRSGPMMGITAARENDNYIHLFHDMLIVATTVGNEQYFETYYSLAGGRSFHNAPTSKHRHLFSLQVQNGRTVTFAAATKHEADSWVNDIRDTIAEIVSPPPPPLFPLSLDSPLFVDLSYLSAVG